MQNSKDYKGKINRKLASKQHIKHKNISRISRILQNSYPCIRDIGSLTISLEISGITHVLISSSTIFLMEQSLMEQI